ncbi:MAG TPA: DUF3455 domain-containing protein [Thermoanaerobaculia bacterium]
MKTLNVGSVIGSYSVVAILSGCASSPAVRPPDAPEALRPPAEQVLALEVTATGAQIYECSANKDQPERFEWVFKAPEAELFDRTGRKVGKHYAGPTWESTDGSTVVGDVKARDAGPDPNAIPWLLLSAKSTSGSGVFSRIQSIQRLHTVGGKAPTGPCTRDNAQQVARSPYKAAYYFYAARK